MLSVNAIYENGSIRLLEDIPGVQRAKVIVTVVEEFETASESLDASSFDDLVGAVCAREDGSSGSGSRF
ncbi:hypothetical protein [Thiohalocapsa sp. ML1]|uniref:hypothetical protein n=1 Tax=Thiohalocapsa sp. ML1 TaxID=1431688 RepID=UPI000731F271|nr:hypothetical protein [Thiohalocapsa sp. ML1]